MPVTFDIAVTQGKIMTIQLKIIAEIDLKGHYEPFEEEIETQKCIM